MIEKRVLNVDDALIMRRRIAAIAIHCGWSIAGEAGDGEEAIKLYRETKPDLVTLDIVMPRMDGVNALREIRDLDPQAKVVMVTAVNQKEKLVECVQAGAIDFIVKPFDQASLRSFFVKHLNVDKKK